MSQRDVTKNEKKKGGRRKIPNLAQGKMPMHELSSIKHPITGNEEGSGIPKASLSSAHKLLSSVEDGLLRGLDDDEFEDDFFERGGELDWEKHEENIRFRMDIAYRKMKKIMDKLSPEQMQRYDAFRRAGIQRPILKKWMSGYVGQQLHPNISIIMAGMAKLYVGELVEASLEVKSEWQDQGALLPSHVREAYRRINDRHGNLSPTKFTFSQRPRIF